MRVAILGGAGLLGSELYSRLVLEGHDVVVVDNFSGSYKLRLPKETKVIAQDASDLNSLRYAFNSFKPEALYVCINFFFNHDDTNYKVFDETRLISNVANNLASILTKDIREVYYCSSHEVYGGPKPKKPVKESRKVINPSNLRGIAFRHAEDTLMFRCAQLGIKFVAFRVFDLYGNRLRFTAVTGTVNFLAASFLSFEQVGLSGAKQKRDFIHSTDAAEIIHRTSKTDFCGVMNVGSGVGVDLISVCKMMYKEIDIRVPPVFAEGTSGISCVADTSLCESVTGFVPKIMLKDCIKDIVKFRVAEAEFYSSSNSAAVLRAQRGL